MVWQEGLHTTTTHSSSLQFSSGEGVGLVELRLGESAGGGDMAGGPHYFADPPHTLGEGEEEENEEIGREFLVAFGAPVQWLASTI